MALPRPQIKPPKVSLFTVCLILGLLSICSYISIKLYTSTQLLPIGSQLRALEEEVEKISDSKSAVQNDIAYYSSTELIRIQAETELSMNEPDTVIYLPADNQAHR